MYTIIRLVIWGVIFVICFVLVKKSKIKHKRCLYLVSLLITIILGTITCMIPFENMFLTFSSPEAAFGYVHSGIVDLTVDGRNTAMVIAKKSNNHVYAIVPKSNDGWKLGIGLDTRRIVRQVSEGIVVEVYQYKDTDDYYIVVLDTDGGASEISDNQNSEFYYSTERNSTLNKTFYTYYAYIHDFNDLYTLTINRRTISLAD
jgi:hypothetical protein